MPVTREHREAAAKTVDRQRWHEEALRQLDAWVESGRHDDDFGCDLSEQKRVAIAIDAAVERAVETETERCVAVLAAHAASMRVAEGAPGQGMRAVRYLVKPEVIGALRSHAAPSVEADVRRAPATPAADDWLRGDALTASPEEDDAALVDALATALCWGASGAAEDAERAISSRLASLRARAERAERVLEATTVAAEDDVRRVAAERDVERAALAECQRERDEATEEYLARGSLLDEAAEEMRGLAAAVRSMLIDQGHADGCPVADDGPDAECECHGARVDKALRAWDARDAAGGEETSGSAIGLIAAERARQIAPLGYDAAHDAVHDDEAIAWAAACYAAPDRIYRAAPCGDGIEQGRTIAYVDPFPWSHDARSRVDGGPNRGPQPARGVARLRLLVKAGALIVAEIERLRRAAPPRAGEGGSDG